MTLIPAPDDEVVARAREGDRAACEELVRREYGSIYRFLLHLTRDIEVAADLTQLTFQKCWQRIHQVKATLSARGWLRKMAYRVFIDEQRSRERERRMRNTLENAAPRTTVSPVVEVTVRDSAERLHEAIEQLPLNQRTVVCLHYLDGLSLRETAEVLGEPVGTVKWRASSALESLRTSFEAKVRE